MMSASEKFFERPKVRFSKSAESPEKLNVNRAFGRPKIRSVKTLEPQITILKAPLKTSEFQLCSSPEEVISRRSAGDAPNDVRLCPVRSTSSSTPCLSEVVTSPETRISHVKFALDKRKTGKSASEIDGAPKLSKSSLTEKKSSIKSARHCTEPDALSKHSKSILTEKKSSTKNVSSSLLRDSKTSVTSISDTRGQAENKKIAKTSSSVQNLNAGKENYPSVESKRTINSTVSAVSTKKPEIQTKSQNIQSDVKKLEKSYPLRKSVSEVQQVKGNKVVKSNSAVTRNVNEKTNRRAGEINKKIQSKPIGLMACMKSKKVEQKNDPMKKMILRDASAGPSDVYIGPGFPRSKSFQHSSQEKEEKRTRSHLDVCSGDRLARPEYNSIACTLKKLRQVSQEKVIQDIEHLPAIYRRLIKGKVSSALDFGANEEIFHGLIDLSIDEKQLPTRLTRSKDPEPRQRDVTPKLSDFFVPTNDEEYKRTVLVRPPSPGTYDTWDPYKITKRMFSWKENLDHEF